MDLRNTFFFFVKHIFLFQISFIHLYVFQLACTLSHDDILLIYVSDGKKKRKKIP